MAIILIASFICVQTHVTYLIVFVDVRQSRRAWTGWFAVQTVGLKVFSTIKGVHVWAVNAWIGVAPLTVSVDVVDARKDEQIENEHRETDGHHNRQCYRIAATFSMIATTFSAIFMLFTFWASGRK